jgi:hypothetical protein
MKFHHLFGFLLFAGMLSAQIPQMISHQGRIAVNGVNFNGTGQFKFVLYSDRDANHNNGNERTLWASAPFTSSTGVSEPATSVTIPVIKGLYQVRLGDNTFGNPTPMPPIQVGIAPLPIPFVDLPGTVRHAYLRIWFSDGVNGFQALTPDQAIDSVPYSIHAGIADSVARDSITSDSILDGSIHPFDLMDNSIPDFKLANGAITASKLAEGAVTANALATGSVTTAKLAIGAITQAQLAPGAVTQMARPGDPTRTALAVGTDGLIAAGYGAARVAPASGGTIVHRTQTTEGLIQPSLLRVQNGMVYVADQVTKEITAFEFQNYSSLVRRGSVLTTASTIKSMDVENQFLYLGDTTELDRGRLRAFQVQDPTQMTLLDSLPFAGDMKSIDAVGANVFIVQSFNNGFYAEGRLDQIFAPTATTGLRLGSFYEPLPFTTGTMKAFAVEGNLICAIEDASLTIFELLPGVQSGIVKRSRNQLGFINPVAIELRDNRAYVLDAGSDQIHIVDVTNRQSPVLLGSGGNGLADPKVMRVVGGFAYVIDAGTAALNVFDVSDPSSIVSLKKTNVGMASPADLDVEGNFAFVADSSGSVHVFQVAPTVSIADGLAVSGDSTFDSLRVLNTIALRDGSTLSAYPNEFLRDDGSEPLKGNLTVQGTAIATDYRYATPKSYTLGIPGSAVLPQIPSENYFRSTLGFIQLSAGTDTSFNGIAEVNLPEDATITGMDAMYYDNSGTAEFSNLSIRLRRVNLMGASVSEENILSTDVTSASATSSAMIFSTNNTPNTARTVVDNAAYTYFVSVGYNVTAPDSNLRFYGFRIRYTLQKPAS